jgi:putative endonuclease
MSNPRNKWLVYMLECSDKSLYTGITCDLKRRFAEHLAGRGSKYVRSRKAGRIVYREGFGSKRKALRRESEIKGLSRQEKLKLIK